MAYLFRFLDASWSAHALASERPDLHDAPCLAIGSGPLSRACEHSRIEQPVLVALSLARWDSVGTASAKTFLGDSTGEIAAPAVAALTSSASGPTWFFAHRAVLDSAQLVLGPLGDAPIPVLAGYEA
jgi:hypothetical protein